MKYKDEVFIKYLFIIVAFSAQLEIADAAYDPLTTGFPPPSKPDSSNGDPTHATPAYKLPMTTASGTLLPYDPFMDNHFTAPNSPQGFFGKHVKEVESILRSYGAKPYSYAFGKHSRLEFSVYLITLFFDRNRKVAEIQVEPKPPYKIIEPKARNFFMQLLTKGTQPSDFATVLSPSKISIKYVPSDAKR